MDLARYRALFLEEAHDHLAQMSDALLHLEKEPGARESIDLVFRMAHSVKSMAASLDYDAITTLAHAIEDRMERVRAAGRVAPGLELSLLFRGLEGLERGVACVAANTPIDAPDPQLLGALAAEGPAAERSGAGESSAAAKSGDAANTADEAPAARSGSEPAPEPKADVASRAEAPRSSSAAPLPSVRVRTETLDRFLSAVGEVILVSGQVRTASGGPVLPGPALVGGLDRMDRMVGELQRRVLELRTAPLLRILEQMPRLAREVAQQLGKRVEVELRGAELELDRAILDRLGDPIVHLLRNAIDHGLESSADRSASGKPEAGRIVIDARREKDEVRIAVRDDGRGIDLDAVRARAVARGLVPAALADDLPAADLAALIFQPGLSTAAAITEVSGRGVGMDAVRSTIEALGGRVELETGRGLGTTTTLIVPITAAVQRVLLLGVGGAIVAVPISKIERILEVSADAIERSGSEAFALIDDEPVPVFMLSKRLALASAPVPRMVTLAIADVRGARVGLVVERLVGQQEIYVKPLPPLLAAARALSGLTVLGDGSVVFLLDLNQLP